MIHRFRTISGVSARSNKTLLQGIRRYPCLILIAVDLVRVILEADSIPVLIHDFTGIFYIGVFIYNSRRRFQDIYEKNSGKYTDKEGKQTELIKEFHHVSLY
jgi:hypothetical protein